MRKPDTDHISRGAGRPAGLRQDKIAMVILVFCSCPNDESADRIAEALVAENLAACVNRMPGVVSTYRWEGAIQRDSETLLIIKATRARFEALRERVVALHPHALPEVVAIDVVDGLDRYLAWVETETSSP